VNVENFAELVEKYRWVMRRKRYLLNDPSLEQSDIESAVIEGLVIGLKEMETREVKRPFLFLYNKIRTCLRRLESSAKRNAALRIEVDPAAPGDDWSVITVLDVRRAVGSLRGRSRMVAQFLLDGYRVKEIARAMGVSSQAVSKYKRQALNRLRWCIRGEYLQGLPAS
jgi:DNA-directed RNA polymerase specialized sigma24 family protein